VEQFRSFFFASLFRFSLSRLCSFAAALMAVLTQLKPSPSPATQTPPPGLRRIILRNRYRLPLAIVFFLEPPKIFFFPFSSCFLSFDSKGMCSALIVILLSPETCDWEGDSLFLGFSSVVVMVSLVQIIEVTKFPNWGCACLS